MSPKAKAVDTPNTNSAANPSGWEIARLVLESKGLRTAYIWGPPGIGKTYGAQRWGLGKRNVYTVTLTEETPAAELRGHFIPKDGNFVWHDGPAARAMREGARLILNEAAHASCDALSFLYAVMESPETAKVTLPTGEILRPAEGFQCIITDNVSPSSLPEALRDRMDVTLHLNTPSPEALESFPKEFREVVMTSASIEESSRRISLRSWESIERLSNNGDIPFEKAAKIVLGAKWDGIRDSVMVAYAAKK